MRWKATNPTGSPEYYREPYTVQHFTDWLSQLVVDVPRFISFALRHTFSKRFRLKVARNYNRAMFGNIPTSQIYVPGEDGHYRQLRPEERTWPE